MIYVTVGMHFQAFDRLIRKMDEYAGSTKEDVVMQIGVSKFVPKNARFFRFLDRDSEIETLMHDARIIVSHAGAGTILMGLSAGKPMIVVPRLQKMEEHVDDQQLDLTRVLSEAGLITPLYDVDAIDDAIERSSHVLSDSVPDRRLQYYLKSILRCGNGDVQSPRHT